MKNPNSNGANASTVKPVDGSKSSAEMFRFVLELVRPYRKWLILIFIAMLIETAMSIAAPWPLKIILDNVVGNHKLPEFLAWLRGLLRRRTYPGAGGRRGTRGRSRSRPSAHVAGYIDNYYTESVAQYVANDLAQAALSSSPAALAEVLRLPTRSATW